MAKINPVKKFNVIEIRKRFGKPNKFGQCIYGWSWFGNLGINNEVYRSRTKFKTRINEDLPYYYPHNPKTASQIEVRLKFKNAVIAWQNLTESEKADYNKLSTGTDKNGYNTYISRYLGDN